MMAHETKAEAYGQTSLGPVETGDDFDGKGEKVARAAPAVAKEHSGAANLGGVGGRPYPRNSGAEIFRRALRGPRGAEKEAGFRPDDFAAMKAGRRRKRDLREPNGRLKRPARPFEDVMSVALRQPHRRFAKDPRDPFHESFLGKFILANKIDRLAFDAALSFARLTRQVFAARGIPQPTATGHRATGEREISSAAAKHLQDELKSLEKRLRAVSEAGTRAVREMSLFEREAPDEYSDDAAAVLADLALLTRG
jgi:hypothetical protein